MEEGLDEPRLAAWRAFITAHATVIGRIERDMAAARVIPLTWYDVLIELYEAPERRLRLHELADAVVLSRSGLSRLIDRLEVAGFLRREAATTDRRGAYAVLTNEGVEAMRVAWPVYARGIADYFVRHLSDAEAPLLADVLGRVLAGARESP
jgi:DNA-binding MarR family transcriptional regulator